MSNKPFDDQFEELFNETVAPADPDAKNQAINNAKAEFRQAFTESPRQNSDGEANQGFSLTAFLRRLLMNPIEHKLAYGAFGTIAVGFLAFTVINSLPTNPTRPVELNYPAVVENTPAETSTSPSEDQDFGLEEIVVSAAKPTRQREEREANMGSSIDSESLAASSPEPQQRLDSVIRPSPAVDSAIAPAAKLAERRAAGMRVRQSKVVQENLSSAQPYGDAHAPTDHLTTAPPTRPDSGEQYAKYQPNKIIQVEEQPVSTFSIDVDTASYALVRSQLNSGLLPKPQAVRAEELINYFDYNYPLPKSKGQPFEPSINVLDSPWNEGRKLVHIGVKGYDIETTSQPDSNLVFLLDVSGSMNQANKLPLVKQSMGLLLDTLKPTDTVSIVVYAGAAGTVLEPTEAKNKAKIVQALQNLSAGGSTAGGQGIRLAYQLAEQNFKQDAVNRIMLATDGDFNVGQSSNEDLQTLVERKRDNGIFLSVLGFGRNNYQDDLMQTLAQNGNGVAAYIDTLSEAKKVLVDEASSTLFPIAKDVKLQVEFNPAAVSDYRLVGYETRALNREDFNNDKVDAGDIGAGHSVTAIYEVTPQVSATKTVDSLRYQSEESKPAAAATNELGFLKIRYKLPTQNKSRLIEAPIVDQAKEGEADIAFSVAVAGFAQLLANNPNTGALTYDDVIEMASQNKGADDFGYRTEFIQLARMAKIAQP